MISRRHLSTTVGWLVLASLNSGVIAQEPTEIRLEVEKAIARGLNFLLPQQNEKGFWLTPEDPALSALILSALMEDPTRDAKAPPSAPITRGYDFLMSQVKPNGGIYARNRANYNTAISLSALVLRGRPEDEQIIRAARKFVAGQQNDVDEPGKADNIFDGGIGYGDAKPGAAAHADLSNMAFALEALHDSKQMFADTRAPIPPNEDINYTAALQFIQRCQNLPTTNDQVWAGADKKNIGAFAYTPEAPKKDEVKDKEGRQAMRYYGGITYAGMMSFIYAGLTPEDPRVQAALKWLGENYTLDENPGLGASGQYYYYHTMAKALSAARLQKLNTVSGQVDWREALAQKLISLQTAEGSWSNQGSGRWMESNPVLVTVYSVLALEHIHRALR